MTVLRLQTNTILYSGHSARLTNSHFSVRSRSFTTKNAKIVRRTSVSAVIKIPVRKLTCRLDSYRYILYLLTGLVVIEPYIIPCK